MTRLFDDIYGYVHPIGANCNIYVFKDGSDLDLIDSGVGISGIQRWLWGSMRKDGLEPTNVRNIFHTHLHSDHVQADRLFQQRARRNRGQVRIYYPKLDNYRWHPRFRTLQSNMFEVMQFVGWNPAAKRWRGYPLGIQLFSPLFWTPRPENRCAFVEGQTLTLGRYKTKVYTPGGHTRGHAIFEIETPEKIVVNGDAFCINEYTSDFLHVLDAIKLVEQLQPVHLFGGHDAIRLGREFAIKDPIQSLRRLDSLFRHILVQLIPGRRINLSQIGWQRVNWLYKMGVVEQWAQMTVFCMAKTLEDSGIGHIKASSEGMLVFEVNEDPNQEPALKEYRQIGKDRQNSPSSRLFNRFSRK